jgi:PAS domain S-box-containing protein
MGGSPPRRRALFGGLISLIGLVLAAIVVYDMYADVVLQDNALYTTVVENSIPLLVDGLIVASGYWLLRNEDLAVTRQAAIWSGGCVVAFLAIAGWVYGIQQVQGQIKPFVILAQVASMGVLAGIVLGIYSGRQSQRERQLAALFENSGDAIAEIRFEGNTPVIRDVNPQFEETFGYPVEEVRGVSIDEVIVDATERETATNLSRRALAGERYETTVERCTASGEERVFRLQSIPISTGTRAGDGYAVYTDITATRRYTERVNALHEATRELLRAETRDEVAQHGVEAVSNILDLPLSGVFVESGDELEPVALSETAQTVLGDVGPLERGASLAWEVYESGQPRNVGDLSDVEGIQNPETPVAAEMIVPLDDDGVLLVGDTEPETFSKAEFTLAQILGSNMVTALDRVTRTQELRNREQELTEQNRRLETFTSVVSHDLRNPLAVATGHVELAREEAGETPALDHAAESLERMDTMIEEILTLARHGETALSPERVELSAVASAAWEMVETGDATLAVEGEQTITADRNRIQQLLENLFRNAVEHGSSPDPPPGRQDALDHGGDGVSVTVGPLDDRGFYVADDGPGIPADERDAIFDHGYTTTATGTGFGLAIVESIVDAHGGTVSVTESESGGARFEIRNVDVDQRAE